MFELGQGDEAALVAVFGAAEHNKHFSERLLRSPPAQLPHHELRELLQGHLPARQFTGKHEGADTSGTADSNSSYKIWGPRCAIPK